jgi:hypothetical protein
VPIIPGLKPISQAKYKTIGTVLEWQMSGKLK